MSRFQWLVVAGWIVLLLAPHLQSQGAEFSPQEQLLRATCRVNQGKVSGTGFLVEVPAASDAESARIFLVTANHVLDGFPEAECNLILREPKPDGTFERQPLAVKIREEKKPLWVRHPQDDVAAIEVKLPLSVDMQPIPLSQVADADWAAQKKVQVGQDVWIACFPAQLEANPAGWPILRRGTIATHPLTPLTSARTILIDYSHFGGDSGSPVVMVHDNRPIVVGLVFGMTRQTDRSATPFEERVVHTSLGLAITVQSPLVRETIEMAAGK